MNRLSQILSALSLGTIVLLSGCGEVGGSAPTGNDTRVLRLGHASSPASTWHQAALFFADQVYENTGGTISVEVFPSELLGPEVDNINSIQLGTADMVFSGESMQAWAPIIGLMSAPFLIEDSAHMHRVLNSEVGELFTQAISDHIGLTVLTYFERGPRLLTANRPVHHLGDLNNLRVRIPNVPIFVDTWQAWGASPTTMAFSEVFTSLQQNVIDAQENPLAMIHAGAFQEVQDYLINTAHVRSWIYVLIGNDQWESLTDSQRAGIQQAANDAQAYEHVLFLAEEAYLFDLLTEHYGMTFIDIDQSEFSDLIFDFYTTGGLDAQMLELFLRIHELRG